MDLTNSTHVTILIAFIPVMMAVISAITTLIVLRVNRGQVAATADKTQADALVSKATAKKTEADTTRLIIDMYQETIDDMAKRLVLVEEKQAAKDNQHSAMVVDLNKHIEGLSGEIKELNLQINGLKELIESQQGESSKLIESLNQTMAGLQETITEQGETISSLQKTIAEQNETIKEANETIVELNKEVARLEQTLKETTAALGERISNLIKQIQGLGEQPGEGETVATTADAK